MTNCTCKFERNDVTDFPMTNFSNRDTYVEWDTPPTVGYGQIATNL